MVFKNIKTCGPKFISFEIMGVFRCFCPHIANNFYHPYRGFAQKCALFYRVMPQMWWRWWLALKPSYSTPITLSVMYATESRLKKISEIRYIFFGFLHATACNASRALAIVEVSVCLALS